MPFAAPDTDLLPSGATTAFGDPVLGGAAHTGRHAQDVGDAILAGMQSSATGLALRGKVPDVVLGEDAPWYHRLSAGAASVVSDLPLSIVGAVGGAAAGTAVAPGPGTAVGAGAGAFAAPMALRDALMEAYTHNYALSWEGAWEVAKAAMVGGTKGAVIGGVTAGAGGLAARAVGPAVAAGVGTTITAKGAIRTIEGAALGSELAALTATSSALEGKLPTAQDFMDNAILLGGLKAAGYTAKAMMNVYAATGRTPEQVLGDAQRDPALKEALQKQPLEIPEAYRTQALEERIKAAIDTDTRPEMIRKAISGEKDWVPLGNDPIADPVKYEYVTDRESAQGVVRAVAGMYENEIRQQTRGEVPNTQTALEAMKLIDGGQVLQRSAGDGSGPADIYARAHILRGATNDAVAQLKALAAIPEAEQTPVVKMRALAAIERVSMLYAEFSGSSAELGRALQVLGAIKRDPSYLGNAQNLLAAAERKGNLQDIASLVERFKDPAQASAFLRGYYKAETFDQVMEAWRAAILSGPLTQLRNIMGNVMKWFVDVPENMISATLTAVGKAAHGDPMTLTQWKARAFAPFIGLQLGAKDALQVAGEVWRGSGEHIEKADQFRAAIPGITGEIVRTPFKALQTVDAMFRTTAERAKAYEMAVDRAVKEGLHSDTAEWNERVVQYTQTPELGLTDRQAAAAIETIQKAGAEAVFAQRLGPFMETVQGAITRHAPILGFIVPFIRTPANLVSWAVQHTPGLNILSSRWREDFAAGGESRAKAVARVVVGAGLTMTAYELASNGLLTGGGLFDKEDSGTKRAAGWQPYSIKIGDKYYSYQGIEPVSKVLGIVADLIEMSKASKDDQDKAKMAAMTVLLFGNATVSTTYLSGLSGAIQSVTDPERYGGNFLEQYATSVVPKIVGQPVAMMDPHKREVDGVVEAVQSQLPFLREKLLPKRDVWGEPQENGRWFAVTPIATSEASHDKVKTEAVRLQLAIQDAPKFMMEKGPFNNKDKRTELTGEQRDIFREVSGKNAMSILAPIVNAPDWESVPDFAKAAIYKGVLEATRKQAAYAALPPESAEREKLRQKIIDRIIKETQAVQGEAKPAPAERTVK